MALSNASGIESIIDQPKKGAFGRRMLHWRVPHFGWVKMSINPKQIQITEKKEIGEVRTKAGFILQYAGEHLTSISITGTTGSAGIEGINILREVYRAEQFAFDRIASELERTGPLAEMLLLTRGVVDAGMSTNNAGNIGDAIQLSLNAFNNPFPTLASLAVNIELYFQGELFRGYFKDFVVTESAEQVGLFDYTMNFTAHSRQGIRRNFMPWHQQPFSPIGLSSGDQKNLSFQFEQYDPNADASKLAGGQDNPLIDPEPERPTPPKGTGFPVNEKRNRSLAVGSGPNGESLSSVNFEDLV